MATQKRLHAVLIVLLSAPAARADSFIGPFQHIGTVSSTVPMNGDVNPYGVAVVPTTTGKLREGNVLVSNFNDKANLQGTGSTIVEVSPGGKLRLFAQIDRSRLPGDCPGGIGLTTALVVLRSGWVIVGSLPTSDGSSATMQAGCLLVLDAQGRVVKTFSGGAINGPWDMTALDGGENAVLFVTNVLNGTVAANGGTVNGGTVLRIVLKIEEDRAPVEVSRTVIGTGFGERTDPAALVVGPTGVALGHDGTLYVADSVASRIVGIPRAAERERATPGFVVSSGEALDDPLGLAIAPNGDILTTNGGDGNLVETTPAGRQIAVKALDTTEAPPGPPGNGTLFGVAIAPGGSGVYFVDDGTNTLNLLQ
jgi:hypothetical protein